MPCITYFKVNNNIYRFFEKDVNNFKKTKCLLVQEAMQVEEGTLPRIRLRISLCTLPPITALTGKNTCRVRKEITLTCSVNEPLTKYYVPPTINAELSYYNTMSFT